MMNKEQDQKLIQHVREVLDESVANIDAATLSRIRQARARALAQRPTRSTDWFGLLSGAVATACVMVFAVIIILQSPATPTTAAEDIDLISSSDNLELFEELEFYEWLEDYELPS